MTEDERLTRREIAAANACAGIPTEALEVDVVKQMIDILKLWRFSEQEREEDTGQAAQQSAREYRDILLAKLNQ